MKTSFFYILILSFVLVATGCRKGELMHETNMTSFSMSKLIMDSPGLNFYLNDTLFMEISGGEGSRSMFLPEGSGPLHVEVRTTDDTPLEIADTTISKLDADMSLIYLYHPDYGFNQFVGPDFKRPSPDSLSIQILNKYDFGSKRINMYIYSTPDGYSYDITKPLDSLTNIPLNTLSSRIVVLPANDADGNHINYAATVSDAVTRVDESYRYLVDAGYDPLQYGAVPLNMNLGVMANPGQLNILQVNLIPWEENGKFYAQYNISDFFKF